ncbi:hypothetical protein EST38_g8693 [Candolleomyces aberdarensis]|uniref:Fungal-type protein kinase domain-containing protein n=1 Tax=Candolleomyces aberdarensis TaxID=2316362 RepID=A0A4Q2DBV2_9AGAR|nr:hypothetical protein EST38_g8693 [Candolleomyces aberdarensis]
MASHGSTGASVLTSQHATASWTIDDTGGPPQTPRRTYTTATPSVDSDRMLEKCARAFVQHQSTATPIAPKISKTRFDLQVPEQKKILRNELEPPIELSKDSTFASSLYHHLASSKKITEFLEATEVYKKGRWVLPRSDKNLQEEKMYEPLVKILEAIIQWFWENDAALGIREVINTHLTNLPHKESVSTTNASRPDISVKAEGPSFQLPHKHTTKAVGYSNIITFFEVKVTNKGWTSEEELLQIAVYVRQIFIQQPNRRFVRALIITEQSFRLFHFDRSGVQFTRPINIHDKTGASTFVRLVLGLSSLYESDAGLDTSIKWEIENGKKVSGTLSTRQPKDRSKGGDKENTVITYSLANVEPTIPCYDIRGRGIVCWTVVDPENGETVLVRDLWRSGDRLSEDIYLQRAKGIPGMVQMISFECNREETKHIRGLNDPSAHPEFRNRIAIRLVLNSGGRSIKHFKSPMELLCALRDAIEEYLCINSGHKELYLKKTLHRDITLDNILLGRRDAQPGNKGLLMGLDMAIFNKRNAVKTSADWKTTTGIYQSAIVLKNGGFLYPLAHDHLDDLESFVYVLTHIMYGYDQTGAEHPLFEMLVKWELKASFDEAESKASYLARALVEIESGVQKRWPLSCIELLMGFKEFLHEVYREKRRLVNKPPHVRREALKSLVRKAPEHYKTVLDLFDEAIKKIESGNDSMVPPTPEPDTNARSSSIEPASSSPGGLQQNPSSSPFGGPIPQPNLSAIQEDTINFWKRVSEEYPDDQPPAKRGPLVIEASPRTPNGKRNSKTKCRAPRCAAPRQHPTGGRTPSSSLLPIVDPETK